MLQSFHFGFWDEWFNPQKVTFDGLNRLILVNEGVTELDVEIDIYSDWKEWSLLYDHGKFLPALRAVGGDPTTAGRALGATFFLLNGWRIRTWEGDHRLTVNGNLYTEEGEPPFVPVRGPFTTIIESNVSNLVDRLTRLGELPTNEEIWSTENVALLVGAMEESSIAEDVWKTPSGLLMELAAKILRNKTITDPSSGQIIVFDDDGVSPLLAASLFEDADGAQPYRGQGAERRERLE